MFPHVLDPAPKQSVESCHSWRPMCPNSVPTHGAPRCCLRSWVMLNNLHRRNPSLVMKRDVDENGGIIHVRL